MDNNNYEKEFIKKVWKKIEVKNNNVVSMVISKKLVEHEPKVVKGHNMEEGRGSQLKEKGKTFQ